MPYNICLCTCTCAWLHGFLIAVHSSSAFLLFVWIFQKWMWSYFPALLTKDTKHVQHKALLPVRSCVPVSTQPGLRIYRLRSFSLCYVPIWLLPERQTGCIVDCKGCTVPRAVSCTKERSVLWAFKSLQVFTMPFLSLIFTSSMLCIISFTVYPTSVSFRTK